VNPRTSIGVGCSEIDDKVRTVYELTAEHRRLRESSIAQHLGPPAKGEAIRTVEQQFGVRLPEHYRCFLESHDGWQGFSGDNALLSTAQILSGPAADWITELKGFQSGTALARGHVIMGSPYSTTVVFFDPVSERDAGEMDVVYWHDGELSRYPDFGAFLDGWADLLRKNIERERTRIRG